MRLLTIIESPFAGKDERENGYNLIYLRLCLQHSWNKGELPFASHAFFPFFLIESDPEERKMGIEAGYQFWDLVHLPKIGRASPKPLIAFYCDRGISPGMKQALIRCGTEGHIFEIRHINP